MDPWNRNYWWQEEGARNLGPEVSRDAKLGPGLFSDANLEEPEITEALADAQGELTNLPSYFSNLVH